MKTDKNGTLLLSVTNDDLVDGKFENSTITEVADECFYRMKGLKKVILPNLIECWDDCFSENVDLASVSVQKLVKCGEWCFSENVDLASVSVPNLVKCGNWCFNSNFSLTSISFPNLVKCGEYCFCDNDTITSVSVPKLVKCGYWSFRDNDTLVSIHIGNHKLSTKNVDGYPFIVYSSKTVKGINIYSGANFDRMKDGEIFKTDRYVAEQGEFTAHGKTLKKAVEDLQFKITAERLKNEPIKADTVITMQHYRAVTGACESGCQDWMEHNCVGDNTITAKELLPLLEKTSAYGRERFGKLMVDL